MNNCTKNNPSVPFSNEKVMPASDTQTAPKILTAACKKWPEDETKIVVAVAYYPTENGARPNGEDDCCYDVPYHVEILQLPEVKVLNHYQGKIAQDAVWQVGGEHYFTLDTAKYYLAKGVRAFALRENGSRLPQGVSKAGKDMFTLFAPVDNNKLIPVLFIPEMSSKYYHYNAQNELTGEFEVKLTISIEKTITNGFADLLITARSAGVTGLPKLNDSKFIFKQLLKYDSLKYPDIILYNDIENWLNNMKYFSQD